MTYYLLQWKDNLKTEMSATTSTFLHTGSRHKAASAQPNPAPPQMIAVWGRKVSVGSLFGVTEMQVQE